VELVEVRVALLVVVVVLVVTAQIKLDNSLDVIQQLRQRLQQAQPQTTL
jgi:hypothetical protein